MVKKGNKHWKQKRRAAFNRLRTKLGFGPGYLHPAMKARINQLVEEKLPTTTRR